MAGGARAAESLTPVDTLSDRELEVFTRLRQSIGMRESRNRLHLSIRTVQSRRARIKEKLSLKRATDLSIMRFNGYKAEISRQCRP
jgi:DNA-binding CsgD family transcriptional regulator